MDELTVRGEFEEEEGEKESEGEREWEDWFDLENKTDLVRVKRLLSAMGFQLEGVESAVRISMEVFEGERVRVVKRNDGLVDYEGVE